MSEKFSMLPTWHGQGFSVILFKVVPNSNIL